MDYDVIVAGAGIGGLSAAVRLQACGFRTLLVDRNERAGGKMNLVESSGYRFDTGPSLVTMPEVFDELFEAAGMSFRDELEVVRLEPYCRYFFDDGSMLETSDSMEATSRTLMRIAPRDTEAFFAFLSKAAMWYRMSAEAVIYGPPLDWKNMAKSDLDPVAFFRARPFQRLDSFIRATFRDERIRRIARLITLYTGCAPDRTPAIFSLIPFLEFGLGRWYVKGGLYGIAQALADRFVALGGTWRPSTPIASIEFKGGRATCAVTSAGERFTAGTFVVNGDVATASRTFLASAPGAATMSRRLAALRPSTSAFVLMLGTRADLGGLVHHNIYFSADEREEWREVFGEGVPPSDPTVYVNHPSFTDPSIAPAGASALFAMVNVPPSDPARWDWSRRADEYEERVIVALEKRLPGLRAGTDVTFRRTPLDFAEFTYADRGSLYGKAPDSLAAMTKRPRNTEPGFPGVYFVGGTTHPGAGIPLAALSGKLVAQQILGRTED